MNEELKLVVFTETVLRGDEFWFRGNYDSAPKLYDPMFSLEEDISCDPEEWTLKGLLRKHEYWVDGVKNSQGVKTFIRL